MIAVTLLLSTCLRVIRIYRRVDKVVGSSLPSRPRNAVLASTVLEKIFIRGRDQRLKIYYTPTTSS